MRSWFHAASKSAGKHPSSTRKLDETLRPFELPEPDEDMRSMVQHIVDNEVKHVPTR